jgi:hypothetical protein
MNPMKSSNKMLTAFLLLAILALGSPRQAGAVTYRSFLRLQKIYVLYTDPIIPHADRQGNFWVGLQPFTLLIGARLAEAPDGSAVVTLRGHRLALTPRSTRASLDGKAIRLTAPVKRIGPAHRMVVPLGALVSAFGLHSQWDKKFHVLTLTDPDLVNQGAASEFSQLVADLEGPARGFVARAKAFIGPPYPLFPIVPISSTEQQHQGYAKWDLKNLSGRSYSRVFIGKEVSGYDYYDSGTNAIRLPQTDPVTYLIRAHNISEQGFPVLGEHSHKSVRYVIARIVP